MLCTAEWVGGGVFGINDCDRTFSVAKLFFAYGLGNALYFPFSVGASTILYSAKPEPERCFEIIERHRPTIFYAVPTAYAAMLAAAERSDRTYDLSSLRVCSSAGEPLPAALYERWKARFGVEILDGIGSTEALHTFISNRPGRARPGSSGELVPGYDARIVDADGRDVPQEEIGDLAHQGGLDLRGYWNQPEKTAATIVGEWIRTGDKYSRDADGYFWYHGRSDDMLKSGGQWVSPAEVEAAIVAHDGVLECGVVGREDGVGPRQAARLRRVEARTDGISGAGRRAQTIRQGPDRGLQVPAVDCLRERPAEDGNGKDPEVQAAGDGRRSVIG